METDVLSDTVSVQYLELCVLASHALTPVIRSHYNLCGMQPGK